MIRACSCGGTYRAVKCGVYVLTTAKFGPYKLYQADRLACDSCGHEIYVTAFEPEREHFEEDFDERVALAETEGRLHRLDAR